MISLFIDTANMPNTFALMKNTEIIKEKKILDKKESTSNYSMKMITELFEESKIEPRNINRIYVNIGPGSFTGIRVGVTIAKTFAWTLQKEIITFSSLELIATTNTSKKVIVVEILDKNNNIYAAAYNPDLTKVITEQYTTLEEINQNIKQIENKIVISTIKQKNQIEPKPNIEKLVSLIFERTPKNPHKVNPVYLKNTDAENSIILKEVSNG